MLVHRTAFLAPSSAPTHAAPRADDVIRNAGIARRLSRLACAHVIRSTTMGWDTCYDGVVHTPLHASVAADERGTLRLRPPPPPTRPPTASGEPPAALRAVLHGVLRTSLASASRVGIQLSGGMDSSAVAVAAAACWKDLGRDPHDLVAYHYRMLGSDLQEVEFARSVANHAGLELVVLETDGADPLAGAAPLTPHLDAPPGPTGHLVQLIAKMRDDGIDLTLGGDSGDEVFGCFTGRKRSPLLLPARLARRAYLRWKDRRRTVRELRAGPPAIAALLLRAERPGWDPQPRDGLVGPTRSRDMSIRSAGVSYALHWWAAVHDAYGVRIELPFLSREVHDYVLTLPPDTVTPGGLSRGLLREAYRDVLPPDVVTRRKPPDCLEPAFLPALRRHGHAWLHEHVLAPPLNDLRLLTPPEGEQMLAAALAGDPGRIGRFLWTVSLAQWCQARDLRP